MVFVSRITAAKKTEEKKKEEKNYCDLGPYLTKNTMTGDTLVDVEQLKRDIESQSQNNNNNPKDSNYDWKFENGRRYASSELGHYYMPNDLPEIQRLNEQHWILTQVKGGSLHRAPLPTAAENKSPRILDMGCGSGIWCIEMAEAYPSAMIVGMDVSPVQPMHHKPANVEWIIQDMEVEEDGAASVSWPFPEDYFDLIHLSLVHGCVANWDTFMAKLVRHLTPGGWVEHQEFSLCRQYMLSDDGQPITMSSSATTTTTTTNLDHHLPPFFRWNRLMEQAGLQRGRALQLGPDLVSFQRAAGLQNVHEAIFAHKWGTWMSDARERALGARTMLSSISGMEGFTTALFTQTLGWSLEETRDFIRDVKRDMRDDTMRKVVDLHVVCGQKPGASAAKAALWRNEGHGGKALDASSSSLGTGVLLGVLATSLVSFWLMRRR